MDRKSHQHLFAELFDHLYSPQVQQRNGFCFTEMDLSSLPVAFQKPPLASGAFTIKIGKSKLQGAIPSPLCCWLPDSFRKTTVETEALK